MAASAGLRHQRLQGSRCPRVGPLAGVCRGVVPVPAVRGARPWGVAALSPLVQFSRRDFRGTRHGMSSGMICAMTCATTRKTHVGGLAMGPGTSQCQFRRHFSFELRSLGTGLHAHPCTHVASYSCCTDMGRIVSSIVISCSHGVWASTRCEARGMACRHFSGWNLASRGHSKRLEALGRFGSRA